MTIEGGSVSQARPTWNADHRNRPGTRTSPAAGRNDDIFHRFCPGQTVLISRHRKRQERLAGLDSCAEQQSPAIAAHVVSWVRRGRDYLQLVIVATVVAADVAEALDLAWQSFRKAAGGDVAGWEMASAAGEVRPGSA